MILNTDAYSMEKFIFRRLKINLKYFLRIVLEKNLLYNSEEKKFVT